MDDLVRRLRRWSISKTLCHEAANALEAKDATIEALRGALADLVAWKTAVTFVAPELGGLLAAMYRADNALALCQPEPEDEPKTMPHVEARYEDRYAGPKAVVATPKEKGRD